MARIHMDQENVSQEQMKEAVLRSGYLLEGRVATEFRKAEYKATTNRAFIDLETIKSREYDVYAYKNFIIYRSGSFEIYPTIICECKNNPQPIAFLVNKEKPYEPLIDEVTVSGIPAKIWQGKKYISVQAFLGVESFHHFCVPQAVVSPKCCTFEKKKGKSEWMATHAEELYETFRTLSKALEYEVDQDFKYMSQWFDTEETENAFMDLSFYYPLVVFQGDIYATYVEKDQNDVRLEKCQHIQFNPEFYSFLAHDVISYHIDVISESYLEQYLNIIDLEMNTIKKVLQNREKNVLASINKIFKECRGLKKKPSTYRKYLE
ncbi:MAG: hypothetical protein ACYDHZ_06505 [Dehalococcoidia bacterium]